MHLQTVRGDMRKIWDATALLILKVRFLKQDRFASLKGRDSVWCMIFVRGKDYNCVYIRDLKEFIRVGGGYRNVINCSTVIADCFGFEQI
jgi:hypothetical protein